jgi:hypothetical protein
VTTTLAGPVTYRILEGPKDYGPLADFSCGKGGGQAEREVNATVSRLFNGTTAMQQLVVVLEKGSETDHYGRPRLIGVCGLTRMQVEGIPGLPDGTAVAYIPAIGTDAIYRDHLLEDGVTRPGSALLMSAMTVTKTMFGGETPPVLAKVLPHNKGSMRMFTAHGFDNTGVQAGENLMLRPPNLDADFRR